MNEDDHIEEVINALDDLLMRGAMGVVDARLRELIEDEARLAVLVAALMTTHEAHRRLRMYATLYRYTWCRACLDGADPQGTLMGLEPTEAG